MEQLIFFAIIIVFSILDSVARKGRAKRAGGGEGETGSRGDTRGSAPPTHREEIPSHDTEPSYDDAVGAGARRRSASPSTGPASSEAMLPAELWAEIAGLATGRARTLDTPRRTGPATRTKPIPRRSGAARVPETVSPTPRTVAPPRTTPPQPEPAGAPPEHAIHLSHAGYGTDPSLRAPSAQDGLDPMAGHMSRDVSRIRSVLEGREGPHALRRAVLLQEVLSPPVALREE